MGSKLLFLALSLAFISSIAAFGAEGFNLKCNGDVTINGAGTGTISFKEGRFSFYQINKQVNGDCENRKKFECYQEGQLMINISKSFLWKNRAEGTVWINGDTDDRPENKRLGDKFNCSKVL